MTTQEFIQIIIQSLLLPLVLWGVAALRAYLMQKTQSLQAREAIELVTDATSAAVSESAQVFVDAIKKTQGKLTQEQGRQAFELAYKRARSILGARGLELVEKTTGNAEAYLRAKIEEAVRFNKGPSPTPSEAEAEAASLQK